MNIKYIFSSTHETFTSDGHIPGPKRSFKKFQISSNMCFIFYNYNAVKLEIKQEGRPVAQLVKKSNKNI